jgi:hypothetical protein
MIRHVLASDIDIISMNKASVIHKHAISARNKGLLITITAALVLILLAAYKIPLIHNEHHGTISGVSEVHNKNGVTIIAIVTLESGVQVLASIPRDLQISAGAKTTIMERRTLLGRKSYSVVAYSR